MKTIPFIIASKRIKYLGINLTKEAKVLYSKNYRTLKKLRKIQISGSIYHVHELEELLSLKCPHYPKQSIDSTQFLLKHQWHISQIKKNYKNLFRTKEYSK